MNKNKEMKKNKEMNKNKEMKKNRERMDFLYCKKFTFFSHPFNIAHNCFTMTPLISFFESVISSFIFYQHFCEFINISATKVFVLLLIDQILNFV